MGAKRPIWDDTARVMVGAPHSKCTALTFMRLEHSCCQLLHYFLLQIPTCEVNGKWKKNSSVGQYQHSVYTTPAEIVELPVVENMIPNLGFFWDELCLF